MGNPPRAAALGIATAIAIFPGCRPGRAVVEGTPAIPPSCARLYDAVCEKIRPVSGERCAHLRRRVARTVPVPDEESPGVLEARASLADYHCGLARQTLSCAEFAAETHRRLAPTAAGCERALPDVDFIAALALMRETPTPPCPRLEIALCDGRPEEDRCAGEVRDLLAREGAQSWMCRRLLHGIAVLRDLSRAQGFAGFLSELRRAKAEEARLNLNKIFTAAAVYFEEEHVDRAGRTLPKRFPPGAGPHPAGSPCDHPGRRYPGGGWRCPPGAPAAHPCRTWEALNFEIAEPHHYRYSVRSSGTGRAAVFTARAEGDLDCNGVFATFEISGRVDARGKVVSDRGIVSAAPLE